MKLKLFGELGMLLEEVTFGNARRASRMFHPLPLLACISVLLAVEAVEIVVHHSAQTVHVRSRREVSIVKDL